MHKKGFKGSKRFITGYSRGKCSKAEYKVLGVAWGISLTAKEGVFSVAMAVLAEHTYAARNSPPF